MRPDALPRRGAVRLRRDTPRRRSPMQQDHSDTSPSLPVWFMTMIAFVVGIAALWFGRGLLLPLAIAVLLFILCSAVDDQCRRVTLGGRALPRWLTRAMTWLAIMALIAGTSVIVGSFVNDLQAALPGYELRFRTLVEWAEAVLPADLMVSARMAVDDVRMGPWLTQAATQVGGGLVVVVLVALYLGFLLSERRAWAEKLPRLWASDVGTARARATLRRIAQGVKQYMWVNAVTSAMSAVTGFIIFAAIGLDFAAMLAITVFLAGFIPTIGAFIGLALPAMVALLQFDTLTPFLIVVIVYGLADQIIANVVQPSLQGRSLNLSTVSVLVALAFWGMIWGGIGAFLAVPMTVMIMVVCAEIPQARWIAVLLSKDVLADQSAMVGHEIRDDAPDGMA